MQELTAHATGVKRDIVQVQGLDGDGDAQMGTTAHGGTTAIPAPATPQVVIPSARGSVRPAVTADETDLPTAKKLRDSYVAAVTVDQTVNDPLDYSLHLDFLWNYFVLDGFVFVYEE